MPAKGRHNARLTETELPLTQAHDGPEDDKPMPLLDHLIELRKRLIYALISFFAVFFITFYFAKPIFSFLIQPALRDGYKVQSSSTSSSSSSSR